MRSAIIALLSLSLVLASTGRALAAEPVAGAPEKSSKSSPAAQVPDVRPFQSARFDLAGTVKLDGVTIDVLGTGELAPPDRERAAFKFGPFTVEIVMVGDVVYTRTRFERTWSRQFVPQPVTVGPFSSAELTRLERDVRYIGREIVGDESTEHYTASLDLRSLVESVAGTVPNRDVAVALESLRGSIDVWVGSGDRMIRQERLVLTLTLPAFEPEGDPSDASLDLTVAYSDLNEAIRIEEPGRNDPTPIRTPRPNVTPVSGPPGSPAAAGAQRPPGARAPAQAPVQVPSRR